MGGGDGGGEACSWVARREEKDGVGVGCVGMGGVCVWERWEEERREGGRGRERGN